MRQFYKTIKEKIENLSLSKQLIFAITLMVFAVLSVVIGFTYSRTITLLTRQNATSSLEILNLKRNNFEKYFKQLKDYSMLLRNNSRLIGISNKTKPFDYTDSAYVTTTLSGAFYSRSDIISYKLYFLQSKTCYTVTKAGYNVRTSSFKSVNQLKNYHKTLTAKNYLYCCPAEDNTGGLMIISRIFINIINHRELAYVEIKVDNSFLRNLSNESNENILCMFSQNNDAYYLGSALINEDFSQLANALCGKKGNGNFLFKVDNKNYLTVFSDSQDGDWRFVEIVPQDAIHREMAKMRDISLLLAAVAFFVSAFLILGLIHMQTKPLKLLARYMSIAGKGDLKTKINISGNAEVKDLCHQFNFMITHIDELIQKNYIAELNEKTARLKALEAQVNPHFLYNTLQAISTEAVLTGQDTIVMMVGSLANLLRYSIQSGNLVCVETEIDYVRQYLYLQSARFDDRLSYLINTDPASRKLLIPKISIQMMVENSIMHGFENSGGQILITVDTKVKDEFLYVFVSDNGSGMAYERLTQVRNMIKTEHSKGIGVGLTNLASQLKILFGENASMSIYSVGGKGTNVQMKIPISEERKDIDVPFADYR